MMRELQTEADFAELLAESRERPVVLMKHSTACGISARAKGEFDRFCTEALASCVVVLVIQQRPLSQHIAQVTGVTHQSPQAILFRNGAVVWKASHSAITHTALVEAVRAAQ